MRKSWEVSDGVQNAQSNASIPMAWFEAIAETTEEAEDREFNENADRMERRARARMASQQY